MGWLLGWLVVLLMYIHWTLYNNHNFTSFPLIPGSRLLSEGRQDPDRAGQIGLVPGEGVSSRQACGTRNSQSDHYGQRQVPSAFSVPKERVRCQSDRRDSGETKVRYVWLRLQSPYLGGELFQDRGRGENQTSWGRAKNGQTQGGEENRQRRWDWGEGRSWADWLQRLAIHRQLFWRWMPQAEREASWRRKGQSHDQEIES